MRKEEAASDVMRISIRVCVFMVKSMVSSPIVGTESVKNVVVILMRNKLYLELTYFEMKVSGSTATIT